MRMRAVDAHSRASSACAPVFRLRATSSVHMRPANRQAERSRAGVVVLKGPRAPLGVVAAASAASGRSPDPPSSALAATGKFGP
jgi:hypothetical protein